MEEIVKCRNERGNKKWGKKIVRETETVEAVGEEGMALIPLVMYLSWICVYFGIFVWK
jgi:hypothetical protein